MPSTLKSSASQVVARLGRPPVRLAAAVVLALVVLASAFVAPASGTSQVVGYFIPITSAAAAQPTPPIRAAFFYPWFPQAWTQRGIYPYTNYTPSLGYYASTDDAVIDRQLQLAADAHLDAFISSWWGPGHHTDTALQHILTRSARADSPNPSLRWAIYYEGESKADPTATQIAADLSYLNTRVFSSPAYLRVGGKPVVFVYASSTDGSGMAKRWADAKAAFGGGVYVVLKVYSGFASSPNQPDSWHQYAPASPYQSHLPYSVAVSPGFWKVGEAARLARDPARFESDVRRMAASGAQWQLITTWSEWGEGTIVEPATQFGSTYVEILCRNLPGTRPCGGAAPTATPTAIPTATRTPAPTATPIPTSTPTSVPVTGSQVFRPVADAYVNSAAPTTNYGDSASLRADGSPAMRSYLRFNVQGTAGAVSRATLKLYANSSSSAGYAVRQVADTTWGELAVTYGSAPALGAQLGTSGPVAAGQWTSVDVTAYVRGNGTYSLALTTASSTQLNLASRESGANAPQLVVEAGYAATATPTSVASPTPAATATPTSVRTPTATPVPGAIATDANLKVAFVADTGLGTAFESVLNLIRAEGAAMVIHPGDFDYTENPKAFEAVVNRILGASYPYFSIVGNHDAPVWNTGCGSVNGCYAQYLKDRLARLGVVPDDPNLNDQIYTVTYRGLKVVFVGQEGVTAGDTRYAPYIQQQLTGDNHIWKVCGWHKNQNAMQVGTKGDEMGWKSYEMCKDLGAIIAAGHEHSYERTKTLTSLQSQTVDPAWPDPARLRVGRGATFAFVSGLGGQSIRSQTRCLPATYPYGCQGEWASIYTSSQGARYGALFITFNVGGDPRKAQGYFKNTAGQVVDQFEITATP